MSDIAAQEISSWWVSAVRGYTRRGGRFTGFIPTKVA